MKALMVLVSILVGALVHAQEMSFPEQGSDFEVACRAKAKEVAAETYRGCVTEARSEEVEKIKKEYQDKLDAMKAQYESEIQRLNDAQKADGFQALNEEAKPQELARTDTVVVNVVPAPTPASVKNVKKAPAKVTKSAPTAAAPKKSAKKVTTKSAVTKPAVLKTAPIKNSTKVVKEVRKPVAQEVTEMSVQLKPATQASLPDESEMDLPEPIPAEL